MVEYSFVMIMAAFIVAGLDALFWDMASQVMGSLTGMIGAATP